MQSHQEVAKPSRVLHQQARALNTSGSEQDILVLQVQAREQSVLQCHRRPWSKGHSSKDGV